MGSLVENKQLNLKEEKTNLMLTPLNMSLKFKSVVLFLKIIASIVLLRTFKTIMGICR